VSGVELYPGLGTDLRVWAERLAVPVPAAMTV
jgi:hypothetical protein